MPRKKAEEALNASGMHLSEDVADLVNKKIREFEQSRAEETEKSQRAHKGRARAAAKTKIKEAKQLVSSTEVSAVEKINTLWSRLQQEHSLADTSAKELLAKQTEICDVESERKSCQGELTRVLATKGKLESLCRKLQQQTTTLVEERRRLTDMERQRRQELADEFQHTIGDVKKTMDQQAQERARLARENEELRSRFRKFFEQYDTREKERMEQQKAREVEVQAFEIKLAEEAQLYRQEATKEAAATKENDELTSTEKALRSQLQQYSTKLNHFQDALSKSDKVLGQYRRQRNKMQRRVEILEKENQELRTRGDRKLTLVTKERDAIVKEKAALQEKCKRLQAERQQYLEDMQKLEPEEVS